jgi:hypothetical protein
MPFSSPPPAPTGSSPGSPAWHGVVVVQIVVLGLLAGIGWWALPEAPPEPPPVNERLQSLEPEGALDAVHAALAAHRRGGALLATAEGTQKTFLALSAEATGLRLVEAEFTLGPPQDGVVPVYAEAQLRGDPFGLPVLLALVGRQRATARLESVLVEGPAGSDADIRVRWCLHRPAEADASWVRDRVAAEAPEATASAPTLAMAVDLSRWRNFGEGASERSREANHAAVAAARELPAQLLEWNRTGVPVAWSATSPVDGGEPSDRGPADARGGEKRSVHDSEGDRPAAM